MSKIALRITLETDVCIPSQNASFGTPRSLRYIPGRNLWGICASRAYRDASGNWSQAELFRLFQAGAVTFGDALPMVDDEVAYAPPLSWHTVKYPSKEDKGLILNLSLGDGRKELQKQSLKVEWCTPSMRKVERVSRLSLRTSINPDTGRARDSYLFGMDAIPAGSEFVAVLEGDQADLELVRPLLMGRARIGRSRNTEYGAAIISDHGPIPALPAVKQEASAKDLYFYCLSRVLLRDPVWGTPTLTPDPSHFGLEGWHYVPSRSFVRTESYSNFHSQRNRPDPECHVIRPGSVLAFSTDQAVDPERVRALVGKGVGDQTAMGLGKVLVNPVWVAESHELRLTEAGNVVSTQVLVPGDKLGRWLKSQVEREEQRNQTLQWAAAQAGDCAGWKKSPSQWGGLRQLARDFAAKGEGKALIKQLIRFTTSSGRDRSSVWGDRGLDLAELLGLHETSRTMLRTELELERRRQAEARIPGAPKREPVDVYAIVEPKYTFDENAVKLAPMRLEMLASATLREMANQNGGR